MTLLTPYCTSPLPQDGLYDKLPPYLTSVSVQTMTAAPEVSLILAPSCPFTLAPLPLPLYLCPLPLYPCPFNLAPCSFPFPILLLPLHTCDIHYTGPRLHPAAGLLLPPGHLGQAGPAVRPQVQPAAAGRGGGQEAGQDRQEGAQQWQQ